jgi:hypothetical protein
MSAAKTKWRTDATTMVIIAVAMSSRNSFAEAGILRVCTVRLAASCTSPPPARKWPRMRAIAKGMAEKTGGGEGSGPRRLTSSAVARLAGERREDLHGEFRWAAMPDEIEDGMQVDAAVTGEPLAGIEVEAGGEELLEPPRHDRGVADARRA